MGTATWRGEVDRFLSSMGKSGPSSVLRSFPRNGNRPGVSATASGALAMRALTWSSLYGDGRSVSSGARSAARTVVAADARSSSGVISQAKPESIDSGRSVLLKDLRRWV